MKKVVIVGGGFVGSYCAKALENDFDTTLIDTTDYFEFTPSILKVMVEPRYLKHIHVKHKEYLKKTKFILGEVKEADEKYVFVKGKKIKFDYLVIASGSKYEIPIKEQNILFPGRIETLHTSHEKIVKAKNIVIIGGGLVGVELAAEIIEKFPKKKVTLLEAQESLILRNCKKSRDYCEKFLKEKGVKVILNEMFVKEDNGYIITNKKRRIKSSLIFMCVGIKYNSEFMGEKFSKTLDDKKRLKVNDFLQLKGYKNIFVGGDVTDVDEEKAAQNAKAHFKIISENIKNLENGEKLKKYAVKKRPFIISLGRKHGVFEYGEFILTGLIPAILKKLVEAREMLGHNQSIKKLFK